jgi:hypothetical protein
MTKYLYRGSWSSITQYYTNNTVLYLGNYYKSLSDNINNLPTNIIYWQILPAYVYTQTENVLVSYQTLYESGSIAEILEYIHHDKGLYKFPDKSTINTIYPSNELHFHKMGIMMMYEYAKAYYDAHVAEIPNITAIYIMQGNRQENVLCQGFSVASVEAVGFKNSFTCIPDNGGTESIIEISQSTKLGNSATDVAFPILDGDNYRMFPVIKISKERKGDDDDILRWRYEEDAITQLMVMNKEEILVRSPYTDISENLIPRVFKFDADYNDMFDSKDLHASYFKNLQTQKFCIFTPDILMNDLLSVNNGYYIKPIIKIPIIRPELLPFIVPEEEKKYSTHTQVGSRSMLPEPNIDSIYYDVFGRYLNPGAVEYNKLSEAFFNTDSIAKINQNEIRSLNGGFSTMMKSMIDIFGNDMQTGDGDNSTTIVQYFNQSREELLNAGILINRTKQSVDDNEVDTAPKMMDNSFSKSMLSPLRIWYLKPFGSIYICPFEVDEDINSLPLVATNLSMSATPYLGAVMEHVGKYISNADIGVGEYDYRNLNNAIVNVCKYNSIENYIAAILQEYNLLDENYHIIGNDAQWNIGTPTNLQIWKGDVFAQKTFMRCIRWNALPDSIDNWEYSWKQGQAFNLYLQSFVNTYLRVPSFDDTFYPYLKSSFSMLPGESESDFNTRIEDNFIWKNTSNQYLKETWTSNAGYHQLEGIIKLSSFDELMFQVPNSKPNRIHYSNKHVSGAFVDQYRQFPIAQYQDFNFIDGPIVKLTSFNNVLFSIQTRSINQHYGSDKLQQADDSSSIILGDRNVLSDQFKQLASFGTQHKESVVAGDNGIYGVDWNKKRLWRIKASTTTAGSVVFGCEDLTLSKSLMDIFDFLNPNGAELVQDLYATTPTGIVAVFDEEKRQILFTFQLGDAAVTEPITYNGEIITSGGSPLTYNTKSYTLVYNEDLEVFMGFYSLDTNFYMKFENRLFSYARLSDNNTNLWEHNKGAYQTIYGSVVPFEIELIINGASKEQNVTEFEKQFLAHIMNSCPLEMDFITWETEYQQSLKLPFIEEEKFYSNPEYKEHNWTIPIIPNKNVSNGPNGTTIFNTFEPDSPMKGQWIKVKIRYTGTEYLYIKNIITNFLISFS